MFRNLDHTIPCLSGYKSRRRKKSSRGEKMHPLRSACEVKVPRSQDILQSRKRNIIQVRFDCRNESILRRGVVESG